MSNILITGNTYPVKDQTTFGEWIEFLAECPARESDLAAIEEAFANGDLSIKDFRILERMIEVA